MREKRIIGGGLTGCTLAYLLKDKYKITIHEKQDHLGGLCFTSSKEGLLYEPHGLHVFHTKHKWIWDWINDFIPMRHLVYRTKTNVYGNFVDYPVNRNTINSFDGITNKQIKMELKMLPDKLDRQNMETCLISMVGKTLYEFIFKNYNRKMWGMDPSKLRADWVPSRIDIRTSNDDRYFFDQWQGYPKAGYNRLFEKLTEGVKVVYNCAKIEPMRGDIVTIPPDEYFDSKYGELEYRGLEVRPEIVNERFYQEVPLVYYPNEGEHVKISENKHLSGQVKSHTLICYEVPCNKGRYYPVFTTESLDKNKQYQKLADKKGITFCGRLGKFKYLNMDECIAEAHQIASKL